MTIRTVGADDTTGELPDVVEARIAATIDDAVTVEADARAAGDAANATAISNESVARANADTALGNRVTVVETEQAIVTGQLAYADVRTAVVVSFAGVSTFNVGQIIAVPPTDKDVFVEFGALIGITTPNDGSIQVVLYDTTGPGAPVAQDSLVRRIRSTDVATAFFWSAYGVVNVGPSTSWRSFGVYGVCSKDSTNFPTVYFENNFFGFGKSFISAEAR